MAQVVTAQEASVAILPVLKDNYCYVIYRDGRDDSVLIDAGEAAPLALWAESRNRPFTEIIATHHHHDHVDGIPELKERFHARVTSSAYDQARILGVDRGLKDGEEFEIAGLKARAMMIPGHTLGHMAIFLPEPCWLFPGDTWFGLGCGRLFEGSAEQLKTSLDKFKSLPRHTRVFCGHEYTLRNAGFALQMEPDNEDLKNRIKNEQAKRDQQQATVPFTILEELATNPFLRTNSKSIRATLNMPTQSDLDVFTELRLRRDVF